MDGHEALACPIDAHVVLVLLALLLPLVICVIYMYVVILCHIIVLRNFFLRKSDGDTLCIGHSEVPSYSAVDAYA